MKNYFFLFILGLPLVLQADSSDDDRWEREREERNYENRQQENQRQEQNYENRQSENQRDDR